MTQAQEDGSHVEPVPSRARPRPRPDLLLVPDHTVRNLVAPTRPVALPTTLPAPEATSARPEHTRPDDRPPRPHHRRFKGLDGLRGLAVLAVVLFHLDYEFVPGGFLGVDVFFVISGFLITTLLMTEIVDTGRLDLRRFYLRRARRLLPTVLVLLVVVWFVANTAWRDQLSTLRGGILSSLGYSTNWWLIADDQSYFVQSGRPTMLQHLWSLAIEEQYYIVWSVAVVVLAGLTLRGRPKVPFEHRLRRIAIVAGICTVVSTLLMGWHAVQQDLPYGASTSRVYFGSDTHAMGLFLGSAAGATLVWRRYVRSLAGPVVRPRDRLRITDAVGVLALALLVVQLFRIDEFSPGLYRGGFLTFDLIALVAILCCIRSGGLLGRLLDIRPLRWVGRRSYAIYIWHWPIVVVTRPGLDVDGPAWLINSARFALILVLASLSYRLVEQPMRRGVRAWRLRPRPPRRRFSWTHAGAVIAAAAVTVLAVASDPFADSPPALAAHPAATAPAPAPASAAPIGTPTATHRTHERVRHTKPAPVAHPSVSGYGDSVLLGAAPALHAHDGRVTVDAVEGRQAKDVLDDVRRDAGKHRLAPYVVIHVGNNGVISPDDLGSTLQALRSRTRVVVLTDRVDRNWQDVNNRTIHRVVPHYRNAVVLDWHKLSSGRGGWLYSDGLHLTAAGAKAYTHLIFAALRK